MILTVNAQKLQSLSSQVIIRSFHGCACPKEARNHWMRHIAASASCRMVVNSNVGAGVLGHRHACVLLISHVIPLVMGLSLLDRAASRQLDRRVVIPVRTRARHDTYVIGNKF